MEQGRAEAEPTAWEHRQIGESRDIRVRGLTTRCGAFPDDPGNLLIQRAGGTHRATQPSGVVLGERLDDGLAYSPAYRINGPTASGRPPEGCSGTQASIATTRGQESLVGALSELGSEDDHIAEIRPIHLPRITTGTRNPGCSGPLPEAMLPVNRGSSRKHRIQ